GRPCSSALPYTTLFRSAGGLAGAVRPQKAHHFAAVDRQRYVFDDRTFAVDLAQARCAQAPRRVEGRTAQAARGGGLGEGKLSTQDRKSTRLNSSHVKIS